VFGKLFDFSRDWVFVLTENVWYSALKTIEKSSLLV
jgi:hypothetical protein